jgi:hypothetical protein
MQHKKPLVHENLRLYSVLMYIAFGVACLQLNHGFRRTTTSQTNH